MKQLCLDGLQGGAIFLSILQLRVKAEESIGLVVVIGKGYI